MRPYISIGYLHHIFERDRRGELIRDNVATSLNVAVTKEVRGRPECSLQRGRALPKSALAHRNEADALTLVWLA